MRNDERRYLEQWLYVDEAYKALLKKRYKESVVLLEKNINTSHGDPYPLWLLSVSYLLTNNFLNAENSIDKIRRLDENYLPFQELEAFLVLKAVNTAEEALLRYLDLEYLYPQKRKYKKIIAKIRNAENFKILQKKIKLFDCVDLPAPDKRIIKEAKRHKKYKFNKDLDLNKNNVYEIYNKQDTPKDKKTKRVIPKKYFAFLLFSIIGFAEYHYSIIRPYIKTIYKNSQSIISEYKEENDTKLLNPGNESYSIIDKIVRSKKEIYYYSEKKLREDFRKAQYLIKDKEYDSAMVLINKIYHSNANIRIKDKANFLRKFILNVKDRKPGDFTYNDIQNQPFLYQGILVKWRGKITNLRFDEKNSEFNMLVNYKDQDTFDGIADVLINKKINEYKNGDIVNISAIVVNIGKQSKKYYLHAYELEFITN